MKKSENCRIQLLVAVVFRKLKQKWWRWSSTQTDKTDKVQTVKL